MSVLKCDDCGDVQELRADVCRAVCLKCKGLMNPLISEKADGSKVPCSDRVMPRVIDKMHIDFERFISSTLNWPIERTGPRYHDEKTAGAWEVFKFAKVA